jgi:lipopolysaccharide biosynthesis glycosyltransferase
MIRVVMASDKHLIRQLGITAMSAIQHSSLPLHFTLLTPDADAADPSWAAVTSLLERNGAQCHLMPISTTPSLLQLASHLTPVTYYRLLVPDILPEAFDRVIYMDCDVLVGRDLRPLWTLNIGEHAIGAAEDLMFDYWSHLGINEQLGYFNAGVLLLDLKRIRDHGLFTAALEFAQTNPSALTWSDQCALNKVFTGRWYHLDNCWNYQYSMFLEDIHESGMAEASRLASNAVTHFNNYDRPWLCESAHPLKARYFAIANAHEELRLRSDCTAAKYWTRLKRTLKWRLIASGLSRGSTRG